MSLIAPRARLVETIIRGYLSNMPFPRKNLLTLIFVVIGVLSLSLMIMRSDEIGRLYWEQSGRLLGRPYVDGYVEWVQRRIGSFPLPADQAIQPQKRLAPYTEFPLEYPPGAILTFSMVRLFFENHSIFGKAFGFLMAGCTATATLATYYSFPPKSRLGIAAVVCAAGFAGWTILVGPFTIHRFDSLAMLTAGLGLWTYSRSWILLSAVCFGLGGSVKIWPLLLLPALILTTCCKSERRDVSIKTASKILIAGFVAFMIPHAFFLVLGTSPSDLFGYLSYMSKRPLQIESVAGNLVAIWHFLTGVEVIPNFDFGSNNIIINGWKTLAFIITTIYTLVYLIILRITAMSRGDVPSFAYSCGLIIIITILCSKVFSGEYLIWLYPIFIVSILLKDWGVALSYIVFLLALKVVYWNFMSVISVEPLGTALVFLKNIIGVIFAIVLARSLLSKRDRYSQ
jgi:Glycosyltransferase family 87